jgi:hypothetical protein
MKKVYINIKGNYADLQSMAKEHYKANAVLLKLGYQSTSIMKAPVDWLESPANEMKHRCKALLECDFIYNPETSKHDAMCMATKAVAIASRLPELVWVEQNLVAVDHGLRLVDPDKHAALKKAIDELIINDESKQLIQ